MRNKQQRIIFSLSLIISILSGCTESTLQKQSTARQLCIDNKGIPIKSIWDSRLVNCIFPPKSIK